MHALILLFVLNRYFVILDRRKIDKLVKQMNALKHYTRTRSLKEGNIQQRAKKELVGCDLLYLKLMLIRHKADLSLRRN